MAENLKKPDQFINEFEKFFKNIPYNEKGDFFVYIGRTLYNFSYFNLALCSWQHALKYFIENNDRYGESACYMGLGIAYTKLGDYTKVIEYQKKALVIMKENGNKAGESACYIVIGSAYRNLGDYTKAIEYQKKALVIKKEIQDKAGEAKCYGNLGTAYRNLDDYTKAIEYQNRALDIAKEIGNKAGESDCYRNLGIAYTKLGDYTKAIEYQNRALDIAKETGNLYDEVIIHKDLGLIYNEQKPEVAYNHFKRSVELTEVIGERIVEEEHKMRFYADASRVNAYQRIVPICLRLKNDKKAFEYVERSKSKTFLYLLAASNIRSPVAIVTSKLKSLLADEEKYLFKLRQIQTKHSVSMTSDTVKVGIHNDVAVTTSNDKGGGLVDSIVSELDKIYDKIEKIDPEYVFLRRARPLSLDKIQNILLEKGNNHDYAILIEYFVTKEKLLIFMISPHKFHIKTVQLSEQKLASYIENYRKELVNYSTYGNIGSSWLELSRYLIEPISEYLSRCDLVYFVPNGLLHYLPLHILELKGEPLIKSHAVIYSPSASLLQFYKNKGSGLLSSCASFGIVFKEEAEEVARLFDTRPFLNATKNKVVETTDKDVLHFSCHGYFNYSNPLSSGIELKDGILTAREIFDLKLNSELVTLSACQTGINEAKPGDELIGLTRSLIYAGASSVIVSLWSVDATSTQELMIEFYKLLKSGKDKATALQQAQIKIMQKEEYSHPYYWAPFILVGDWE